MHVWGGDTKTEWLWMWGKGVVGKSQFFCRRPK